MQVTLATTLRPRLRAHTASIDGWSGHRDGSTERSSGVACEVANSFWNFGGVVPDKAASHMRANPAVVDAYERGYQDGVLETLSQLRQYVLPQEIALWVRRVETKVRADRD